MKEVLTTICWDVQHGNALFLKTPNGKNIFLDLGKGSYSTKDERFSPVQHLIKRSRLRKVDLVILTHPHKDHIEDILSLDALKIGKVVLPNHLLKKDFFTEKVRSVDKEIFEKYWQLSKTSELPDQIKMGKVSFHFFCFQKANRSRMNDHSMVTIVSYLGFRLVLMGDNEKASQSYLLENSKFRKLAKSCDILLAPHHARKHGFLQEMMELLNPSLTVISDGRPKETSVRDQYAKFSRGMEVRPKNGLRRTRKVLSTNNDGLIKVEAGTFHNNPKLKVSTKPSKP